MNVLGMIAHDANCIYKIVKSFIETQSVQPQKPEYGLENGYTTYIITNFIQDLSVFTYEMLKNLPDMKALIEPELVGENFFTNLEKMRNAIHIRKPYGSFKSRAKGIIEAMESNFADSHFNISLMYRIAKPNAIFLSPNAYFYHMTNDVENRDDISGIGLRDYSQNIGMISSLIAESFSGKVNYLKPTTCLSGFGITQIESFDYTIGAMLEKMGLSVSSAMRIILMHSYVSFINTMFELISADEVAEVDNYWMFFLAKLYSIRYDEVMDSFDNLNTHCCDNDKAIISGLLDFKGFDRKQIIRDFAQKLRNLIHYGLPNYPPIHERGEYFTDLERAYLGAVSLDTIYDFRELYHAIRFDMKMMQLRFRRLFNMDYPVDIISKEMAKGGKVLV